jgi:hypothetical protein
MARRPRNVPERHALPQLPSINMPGGKIVEGWFTHRLPPNCEFASDRRNALPYEVTGTRQNGNELTCPRLQSETGDEDPRNRDADGGNAGLKRPHSVNR